MKRNRFRLRHVFWLDMLKPKELELAETIEELKSQRTFSATIRDGIRLILDLRAGRLDVLFELFPWVRAEFMAYVQSLPPAPSEREIEMQQRLERMEQLLISQGNQPVARLNGPKPLAVNAAPPPVYDDDDLSLLTVKKSSGGDGSNSSINFLRSVFALNGESLPAHLEPKDTPS